LSCELSQAVAHGYFDGELDAVRAAEFERHLENCAECQISLEHMESLRTGLRQNDLYERASPYLREQLRKQLEPAAVAPVTTVWSRRKFLIPAFGILAAAVAFGITLSLIQGPSSSRITAELVDAHVRSLQPGHLTDVESTDQHTVKPWFDGKLAFIPPVTDYSAQGFPLVGGRLDVLDGNSVAALVYARRKHLISLFVWPARDRESDAHGSGSRQGYSWTLWRSGDMQYCLISDVSAADLRELQDLIDR
jgi:anti-sigma factor RsiW